MTVVLTVLWL